MKGFSVLDSQNHKNKTDTWLTPIWIVNALGEFDLDPCAYPGQETAYDKYYKNGDMIKWHGRVWLNPPYSEVGRWLDMLSEHGRGIALVFARTDTKWAQRHMQLADSVFFLKGRIKFLTDQFQERGSAGHGSMFLAYGEKPEWPFEGWKAK